MANRISIYTPFSGIDPDPERFSFYRRPNFKQRKALRGMRVRKMRDIL